MKYIDGVFGGKHLVKYRTTKSVSLPVCPVCHIFERTSRISLLLLHPNPGEPTSLITSSLNLPTYAFLMIRTPSILPSSTPQENPLWLSASLDLQTPKPLPLRSPSSQPIFTPSHQTSNEPHHLTLSKSTPTIIPAQYPRQVHRRRSIIPMAGRDVLHSTHLMWALLTTWNSATG